MESTRNKLVRIKIDSIVLNEDILKENDIHLFEKLKKTLVKRGQVKNIVVCETENGFECLEGSKIVKALKDLGNKSVIAFNLGELSESEKNIIRIELFRDYFVTNYVMVGKLIKEASSDFSMNEICNTIPFDTRQAQHLVNMHDFDWEDFNNTKLEGQSSLFDVFETEEITESVEKEEQDTNSENAYDDKFYIFEGTEVVSESNKMSIDTEFDERYGKSYEQATNELIEEKKQSEITSGVNIHKGNETNNTNSGCLKEGEIVTLKTPKKGIFFVKITKITEKWVYYIDTDTQKPSSIETPKFISYIIQDDEKKELKPNEEKIKKEIEPIKEQEKLVEKQPEIEQKEEVKQVTENVKEQEKTEKPVTEEKKEISEPSNRPIVLIEKKVEIILEIKKHCLEFAKVKEKDASNCEIDFTISKDGDITIACVYYSTRFNKFSIPLNKVSEIIDNQIDLNSFYQQPLQTDSFYYDHQKRVVIVTKNQDQIIPNIKFIGQQILKEKHNTEIEEENITYSAKELDNDLIEVFSIVGKSQYGVTIRIQMIHFAEFLMKIDFEI